MKSSIFSKKNILTAFLIAILVYIEYLLRNDIAVKKSMVFELTLIRILVCSIIGYILIIIPQKKWDHYRFLKIATTALMFAFVSALIVLVFVEPDLVLKLSKEDGVVENLSASFLFLSSLLSLIIGSKFLKKKDIKPTLIFMAMGALFFVMGMEEISWLQRIADIKPGDLFIKHNMQSETNLHNFNTLLFNDIYYFAGFLLFVVGTFYRKNIKKLLKKFKLKDFIILLPSHWLLLPFSLMVGLTTPLVYVRIASLAIYVLTLLVLLSEIAINYRAKGVAKYMNVLAIVLIIITVFISNANTVAHTHHNCFQEYRELVIALGIMAYVTDIYFINFNKTRKRLFKK